MSVLLDLCVEVYSILADHVPMPPRPTIEDLVAGLREHRDRLCTDRQLRRELFAERAKYERLIDGVVRGCSTGGKMLIDSEGKMWVPAEERDEWQRHALMAQQIVKEVFRRGPTR